MVFPQIKKRISDFLCGEEGRISKQSLISVGAYLSSGVIASTIMAKAVEAQTVVACTGNPDDDRENCPGSPGEGCPVLKQDISQINAYDANGFQIVFGNGKCSDDAQRFHFNGVDFSYVGTTLSAEHHHHGSHNSY
jgi:hypothetical protein